jgi:hypothetical protein
MGVIIAVLILIISTVGAIAVLVFWRKKVSKYTYTKHDRSEEVSIDNTQAILPFEKIELNRTYLGKQRYVAYLKVEPFNYLIRSEEGKDAFAINLRNAFNAYDFRISLFTHTRKMVNEKMLTRLSQTIEETIAAHPDNRDYAAEYFEHLSVINVRDPSTGDLRRVKDYYVLIPWEPSIDEAGMSELELEYRAKEELHRRITLVAESFRSAGISTSFLNTIQIIDLLLSFYRREESGRGDLIFDGDYTSVLVSGDEESHNVSEFVRFAAIIEGARNRLTDEIINNPAISEASRSNAVKISEVLYNIERKIGGE